MKKLTAVFTLTLILSSSPPLHAGYDPRHTMLALNMAIVSVHRILTAGNRAVLEQEYRNIINNLSLGNIENDSDMTGLYRDLMSVITSKRIREDDRKRLISHYNASEKKLITYAMSSVKTHEALAKAFGDQAAASANDIDSLKYEQSLVIASWLGNMSVACVSSFFGNIFGESNMLADTMNSYRSYRELSSRRDDAQHEIKRAKSAQGVAEARISGLKEELAQDSELLKEELKNSQWKLDKEELSECDSLQQKLLTASWNLLRKYNLPDSYRLTQNILSNYYKALNESDPVKRLRMFRVLEDEFSVYPPYWFYRGKAAEESGNENESDYSYGRFNEVWRPVLRKDPYKLEAEKYSVRKLADDDPQKNSGAILSSLEVIRANTPKDDWADNIFAGVAFFVMGEEERGIECVEINVDFEYENEISSAILAQMKEGDLDSINEALRTLRLNGLVKGMSDDVKVRALALADFFDGVEGARENLERLSSSEESPVIFHALRIAEQLKGNEQDFGTVVEYVNGHDRLKGKINGDYSAVMPVVRSCAGNDSVSAKIFMADSLMFGWGTRKDLRKAGEIFSELADEGNVYAQIVMVQSHFDSQKYEAPQAE